MMRRPLLFALLALSTVTAIAWGQDAPEASDEDAPPSHSQPAQQPITVYRQVLPDGRVIYSDKAIKGVKLDHTITVEPPIEGNLWTTESGNRPAIAPQTEPTPVQQVNTIPPTHRSKTVEEATSDVIRAEMLLEDAKARQQTAVREGADTVQQKWLARDVAAAEAALKRAEVERDALRRQR